MISVSPTLSRNLDATHSPLPLKEMSWGVRVIRPAVEGAVTGLSETDRCLLILIYWYCAPLLLHPRTAPFQLRIISFGEGSSMPHDPHECDEHEHHGDEPGHVHDPHECDDHEHHAHVHDPHECDDHEHHEHND